MKRSHLRAAAHNLVDSLSSECSTFLGYGSIGLWDYIDSLPDQRMQMDLLTGEVADHRVPAELQDHLLRFTPWVPKFLREQRCNPDEVVAMRVELRRSPMALPSRKEAVISIELADGAILIDRYFGDPLKRPRYLDVQGRMRPDRWRPENKAAG